MDAVNLQNEYESDSTAVKSLPRSIIQTTTNYGGGDVAAAIEKEDLKTHPSMFNAITGENEYEYYLAYLNVNDLTEAEYPFIHNEDDYVSKEDMENGERAITTSAPQKSRVEVTSMNSFSTLESDSSTTSGKSDEQPQSNNKKSKNAKNSKKGHFFATLKKSFTTFVRGEAAASSDSESDLSIASEIIEGGTRKYAGGGESIAAAEIGCGRSLETNSSMLNAMADGEESTVTAYDFYRAYLKANDLSEVEYPFIPNENDAGRTSKEDIVKWIEDGKKSPVEVTSMNSFSTLESDSSITSEKSNYGIREIANELVNDNDDNTLEDVISLASTNEFF